MKPITIKICGLTTEAALSAAIDAGADMVGFVFHPRSPRAVTPARAAELASAARGRAAVVALAVDADDAALAAVNDAVRPDWWQMHGQEEGARLRQVRQRFGRPVMKAIGWSGEISPMGDYAELEEALAFQHHADMVLLDARPPKDAAYPGGHGKPFDWATLAGLPPAFGFMLSGGLHPGNVAEAIRTVRSLGCNLTGVDVSSGVESAPGVKDVLKIRDFIAAARAA